MANCFTRSECRWPTALLEVSVWTEAEEVITKELVVRSTILHFVNFQLQIYIVVMSVRVINHSTQVESNVSLHQAVSALCSY